MTKTQCLWYGLDEWKAKGGYLLFARSKHWCIPHVLHMSQEKLITHYAPETDLKQPWYSLLGFSGKVLIEDKDIRTPMTNACMFIGTCILFISGGIWAINRTFRNLLK